jgi:acid phosphatase family membrane protein YuiD
MYLQYGHESAAFVIAFCFSFLFWYDAANVRYEAGQHASYLNQLNKEL